MGLNSVNILLVYIYRSTAALVSPAGPSGFAGGSVKETLLLLPLCFITHYVNIQYTMENSCTVISSKPQTKSSYVTVTLMYLCSFCRKYGYIPQTGMIRS